MRRVRNAARRRPTLLVLVVVLVGYAVALGFWTSGSVDGTPAAAVSGDPLTVAPGGLVATGSSPVSRATAGPQTITFRATGTSSTIQVAYAIGTHKRVDLGSVQPPFTRRLVVRATERLAMTAQVAPGGGTAQCAILINGSETIRQTAHGPYAVAACVV